MDMSIVMIREHCARCGRGIYTSWRTLDNKKYYHPHCFTCAECGLILDSIQVAKTTTDEIFCSACHRERCGILLNETETENNREYLDENANLTDNLRPQTDGVVNDSSSSSECCFKTNDNDNNNVSKHFDSSSPVSGLQHRENFMQNDAIGAIRNMKKKGKIRNAEITDAKIKDPQKKQTVMFPSPGGSSNSMGAHIRNNDTSQKRSRIPRPSSAQSKKSLTTAFLPAKSKSKVTRSSPLNKISKSSTFRPPPSPVRKQMAVASKMQRSISLVQARNSGTTENGFPSRVNRSSAYSRPQSALTAMHDERSAMTSSTYNQNPDIRTVKATTSKRQCAASFSTGRKKESKASKQRSVILQSQALQQRNNDCPTHLSYEFSPQLKAGIPSTQTILTAIRREGSEILKSKSSSGIRLSNSESYEIPRGGNSTAVCPTGMQALPPSPPRRSFNMTFECPICISSLVPVSNGYDKGCFDGTSQCPNVVTPCGHLFHGKCMNNWLKIKGNKRCPICSALCLPETLQPVYLECNLCADLNSKAMSVDSNNGLVAIGKGMDEVSNASFRTLRSEYELLKAKYNAILAENHNYSLNVKLATSLQSAYEIECRHRLQLQWENRKLLMKIEELKNSKQCTTS